MATTDRHGFFLWSTGYSQSDVLLNDLLLKLERKVGLSVVSRTTDAQPGAPSAGDCYIMTAGRTGAAWAGFATNDVAIYRDATWYADAPISGLVAWVEDDSELVTFDGTTYQVVTVANPIGDADFAAAEGFMRKTGAGAYEAIKSNLTATTDPGATDDSAAGYAVGSVWINVTADTNWVCVDASAGAAVWNTAAGFSPATGTFTPTLQDSSFSDGEGQTYSEQNGIYRLVGDLCFFWIDITVTSLGSLTAGDAASIGGLPFTAASLGTNYPINVGSAASLAITAGQVVTGVVADGSTRIALHLWDDVGGITGMLVSEYSVGGRLIISGNYIVAP